MNPFLPYNKKQWVLQNIATPTETMYGYMQEESNFRLTNSSCRGGHRPPAWFCHNKTTSPQGDKQVFPAEIPIICMQIIGRATNGRPYRANR